MYKIGVIGGTGTVGLFPGVASEFDTIYGRVDIVLTRTEPRLIYIPRHGLKGNISPSEVNYRAIIDALLHHGVKHVLATTIATRLNDKYSIGDIVVPHDIIDLTTSRQKGFDPVNKPFVDMSRVFSERLRKIVVEKALQHGFRTHSEGVVVVIDGPRFETPAEARMYRALGGDILSMSLAPEAFMSREAGLEYVAIAIVLNDSADKGVKPSKDELLNEINKIKDRLRSLIIDTAKAIEQLES
ncbi:MAG: MTAP family purine nucleoside phosphorylase [Desulfurococcaceae archaeon]|uniref:S-methyl-5'-thioadenosine phosphorylase n=1 Tax=Staphylothermus marinus TaxID=2280 RepID=A0A7C4H9I2_STAMA